MSSLPAAALEEAFEPVLRDVADRASVAERFIDRNAYQIYIATLWANVTLEPSEVGIAEEDLETLHDVINKTVRQVLGGDSNITACFRFINSKPGERAMREARLTQNHKDLLLYFASIILDPEGHKRWTDDINQRLNERSGPNY